MASRAFNVARNKRERERDPKGDFLSRSTLPRREQRLWWRGREKEGSLLSLFQCYNTSKALRETEKEREKALLLLLLLLLLFLLLLLPGRWVHSAAFSLAYSIELSLQASQTELYRHHPSLPPAPTRSSLFTLSSFSSPSPLLFPSLHSSNTTTRLSPSPFLVRSRVSM